MMWSYGHYGGSGFGLVWFVIVAALLIVPFWRLLPRFGIPAPVSIVAGVPLGALVLLWVIAFRDQLGGTAG